MSRPDLCLEFVNTRYWRGQATPTETLNQPEDLATWSTANGGPKSPGTGRGAPRREAPHCPPPNSPTTPAVIACIFAVGCST